MIILSMVVALWLVPDVNYAQQPVKTEQVAVDLSPNQPVRKLFPLTLLTVDGEPVARRNHQIMLDVGEHVLTFSANIDLKYLNANDKILRSRINQRKYDDTLTVNLEAGKSYQLAFDARPRKVEDWKPIVLRVIDK